MVEKEIPLTGGNTNGAVVRVGNTVRRALRPSSATVHRLLDFLEHQGFGGSPRFLGIDASGRETLSFIDGYCGISLSAWRSDSIIETTAQGLRISTTLPRATLPVQMTNGVLPTLIRRGTK